MCQIGTYRRRSCSPRQSLAYVGGNTRANELRVSRSRFDFYAVPALEGIAREIKRREARPDAPGRAKIAPNPSTPEIWVIYGRNEHFRKIIFRFLRDVGLQPIEFNTAVARSGSGSPNVIDVVLKEIMNAPAIVCLFTPDDYAELRPELRDDSDDTQLDHRKDAGFQPRPNVLLETGMALAAMRHQTVIVSEGKMREISDLGGLHEVRWRDSPEVRHDLLNRLEAIGCPVDRSGVDWLS